MTPLIRRRRRVYSFAVRTLAVLDSNARSREFPFQFQAHVELRLDYDISSQNLWLYDLRHDSVPRRTLWCSHTLHRHRTQNAAKTIVARIYIFLS